MSESSEPFVPDGLLRLLRERGAKPASKKTLTTRLRKDGGTPDPVWGPFIPSEETQRRYGFPLPRSVVALLRAADELLIEDLDTPSFRYVRVAPGGWEMPVAVDGEELAVTVARRFEWNTFSNMQLWEHFSGVMPLGWDPGDNRYVVATTTEDAPVFWLDHETADMYGAVASSLERFLRVQLGAAKGVATPERTLIEKPSHWDRDDDELEYLGREGPLTRWPPFLAARSGWVVAVVTFGSTEGFEERPESRAFDLATELPHLEQNEPLALYWLMRSYYLAERDVFDEVRERASAVSPLAASFARLCEERWDAKPKTSGMARARAAVATQAKSLRTAKWPKGSPKSELV